MYCLYRNLVLSHYCCGSYSERDESITYFYNFFFFCSHYDLLLVINNRYYNNIM